MTVRSVVGQMNPSGIDANESLAHRSSGALPLNYLQRYGLAVVSIGVALGISLLLEHFGFRVPSALLLLFAVAISSWYAGAGPAVLAAILSTISCYWYFVQPVHTFYIYWSQIPYFITFTAFAALLSRFGTVRQRFESDLRQNRDLLQEQASLLSPALRLALIYAFFGAVWILVSDRLSFYLVPDLQLVERLQTYKGWFFIAVTSVLLWLLATRFLSQVRAAEEALHRLNRKLQAISNCNQTLLRATDEQSLLEQICRIVCEEAGYRMAFVAYAEHDEAKSVRPVVWSGAEEGYLATVGFTWADTELGRRPTGTAIRSGKTCCTEDFATDPRLAPWRESALQHGYRSSIALPLKDEHDKAFGSLTIYSAQPNASTPEEVRLLEELAGDLAFGIVTLRSEAARKRAEQEVTLLSFALDRVREAAFLVDDTGRFRYVNEDGCRVLGYTREELLGMGIPDIDLEFPAGRWSDHWRDLKSHRSLNFESRHRTRDGRIFPVEISANYFEYAGQAYNLGLVRDISERKRAEEALRSSEAYLAEAQRLTHTGSWAWDVASGKWFYWSEEMFRIFGFDPQEDIPARKALFGRILPEDRTRVEGNLQKALRERVDTSDEYQMTLPDGAVRDIHIIRHPVLNDAGDVVQLFGTAVDITECKRAEEDLRESETRFRAFVDHAADAFFVHDEEHKVLDVNRQACESLGYTPEELIGMHPVDFDPYMDAGLLQRIRERLAAGEVFSFETRHRRKDGTMFPVEVRLRSFSRSGRRLHLALVRDITERKKAEEERLANLRFFESMDRINRAMQGANDLEKVMSDVLDALLSIFDCDRAWLVYPCDPEAPSWRPVMERTRPEFPGAFALGATLPVDHEIAVVFAAARASGGALLVGPAYDLKVPAGVAERFSVRSYIAMA